MSNGRAEGSKGTESSLVTIGKGGVGRRGGSGKGAGAGGGDTKSRVNDD